MFQKNYFIKILIYFSIFHFYFIIINQINILIIIRMSNEILFYFLTFILLFLSNNYIKFLNIKKQK